MLYHRYHLRLIFLIYCEQINILCYSAHIKDKMTEETSNIWQLSVATTTKTIEKTQTTDGNSVWSSIHYRDNTLYLVERACGHHLISETTA